MRGFNGLILNGGAFRSALLPTAILIGFAIAFALVAVVGLRAAENRLSFG
jgi:multisubunit Na+/H+ antiporter MnhC subunit